ncbi:hypothetical protein ACH3XW_50275 [Acanthocheilonema viteae]
MLAPIITKDMNPFSSQPRKARDVQIRSQNLEVSKITRCVNQNQDNITEKSSQPSMKLKSTFVHSSSLSKPHLLPSIVEGVEMRLNLEMYRKYHSIEEGDNIDSRGTLLPTTSNSTLLTITTTTTAVAATSAYSSFPDSSLSPIIGKRRKVKKIQ